ncbi:MAG TPA: SapC family protein [Allosphingosinicella sp.]|jgi:hypothetical protein
MASAPNLQLPLLYNGLEPLSSNAHGNYKARSSDTLPMLARVHAVPITIDEFVTAQRHFPIVFSVGDAPVPLALMGLNEGVNVFVDDEGRLLNEVYVPAYLRRYPFMLARLRPDADDLSLCFDPQSGVVGDFEDGTPLFDNGQPSETTQAILKFCEEFELSAQRTAAFINELKESELLIEGEASVQPTGSEQPFVYRGFQMVSEEKLRELRGDTLRKMNQNGMLPLVLAHLFSLSIVPELFGRQLQQGKGPQLQPAAEPVTA